MALRLLMAILILCAWSGLTFAESSTISAVIPWQGQGQIFPIGTDKLRFLGAIEGIMYVETAERDMDEAFVRCPILQDIDATNQCTSASGNCTAVASTEDAVLPKSRAQARQACVVASSNLLAVRADLPASADRAR